jgi:hypothetical protein
MARFVLVADVAGAPPGGQPQVFPRGTTIADSTINAKPGDVIWPQLMQQPSAINMAPLDASAQALMPGSTIIAVAQAATWPTARDGIAGPVGEGWVKGNSGWMK